VERQLNEGLKMKVRELLQIELWSKRTSRKICIGIGIVFIGFGFWIWTDQHWLTPGERSAAKEALAQIDGLQDFAPLSDQDFDVREKQAEAKVEAAKHAAVTQRDKGLAFDLEVYLGETTIDRDEVRRALLFWERHLPVGGSTTEFGKKLNLSGTELRTLTRLELHKALD
jgi:hypothetical protein